MESSSLDHQGSLGLAYFVRISVAVKKGERGTTVYLLLSKVSLPPILLPYGTCILHPSTGLVVEDDYMGIGKEASKFCFIELELLGKPGDDHSQTILRS